jgi:primosomal protein N' (replication factor Y)
LQSNGLIVLRPIFRSKIKPQYINVVSLAKPAVALAPEIAALSKRAPKQAQVLQFLVDASDFRSFGNFGSLDSTRICKQTGVNLTTLQALERKGFIRIESVQVVRNPLSLEPTPPTQPLTLNAEQAAALASIQAAIERGEHEVFLLHGVTGSGKTEVYMQAMAAVLGRGQSAIVLAPEISLTPQTASRFVGRFGERVAVLHSGLSEGERYDQWQRIKHGDADIVVGPRSAIFAPLQKLGLIVIDEEHETTYKQEDPAPRYHAREVAIQRGRLANCPVILGTATPSLESFYRTQIGEYRLLSLPLRVANIAMPPVTVVDMREELKRSNRSIFSAALRAAVAERLSRGEQVILFLNRRGYSTYVFCRVCGYVEKCANCSISLTFHFQTRRMKCHHCGHERPTSKQCPQCGSIYIRYFGLGTEQVEQEVIKAFPGAKVRRMDADSTTRKDAHQKILDAFQAREIDILVGTQMIAKGLDFPNVTLVGVISADTALNMPDFRAGERTFNLLTQVAGRSGRSEAGGEVIIQTYTPEHYSIQAAARHDYLRFYREEIGYREALLYPPLSRAAVILLRGVEEAEVIQAANDLLGCLETVKANRFPEVEIRGPVAAPLARIQEKFRWHFFLRCPKVEDLRSLIQQAIALAPPTVKSAGVDFIVDIDPIHMM